MVSAKINVSGDWFECKRVVSEYESVARDQANCCRSLWGHVLMRAVKEYVRGEGERKWFESEEEGICSFRWICGLLGFRASVLLGAFEDEVVMDRLRREL